MNNPEIFPPPGYYRVDEAYQLWFGKYFSGRKPSFVEIDDSHEQYVTWLEGHREAVKIYTKDGRTLEVPTYAWDRRFAPSMLVYNDSIRVYKDSPFAGYSGDILIVDRSAFDKWVASQAGPKTKQDKASDMEVAKFFFEALRKLSNDERPPDKGEWYERHRKKFGPRALTVKAFNEIRTRTGKAAVLPHYLRKSGDRQPGWQKNIEDEWKKRLGWP